MTGKRAIDGHAELVVEIRSPNDESYDKLPFYAACKIPECWIIDPVTLDTLLLRAQATLKKLSKDVAYSRLAGGFQQYRTLPVGVVANDLVDFNDKELMTADALMILGLTHLARGDTALSVAKYRRVASK